MNNDDKDNETFEIIVYSFLAGFSLAVIFFVGLFGDKL